MSADGPFCFVYTTLFKKVKLKFPFTRFERELLTELNIAAAQLHPNSWAFVRAFQVMCDHLGCLHPWTYFYSSSKPSTQETACGLA